MVEPESVCEVPLNVTVLLVVVRLPVAIVQSPVRFNSLLTVRVPGVLITMLWKASLALTDPVPANVTVLVLFVNAPAPVSLHPTVVML
ncbi:MAG: hypothetical protein KCHDKBKB_02451 [Elusimicrobia bacterium]|nr:hypothetical protein [Elusimicrobiota bacterium]